MLYVTVNSACPLHSVGTVAGNTTRAPVQIYEYYRATLYVNENLRVSPLNYRETFVVFSTLSRKKKKRTKRGRWKRIARHKTATRFTRTRYLPVRYIRNVVLICLRSAVGKRPRISIGRINVEWIRSFLTPRSCYLTPNRIRSRGKY